MRIFAKLAVLGITVLLVGCTEPETYPISGQDCGPDDPVKTLDASSCAPIQ